jgi:uncharacterized protein YaeQ
MKFTVNLGVDDREEEKLVIAAWKGEMTWHIVLKLLGFILFHEDRPRIEESVQWHYKPDLVALDPETGKIRLWIDCGNIAVKKIDRVATKIGAERFVILRRTLDEARRLDAAMDGKVKHRERVQLIAFDDGLVDDLAAHLDRTNELVVRRAEDELTIDCSNRRGRFRRTTALHRI